MRIFIGIYVWLCYAVVYIIMLPILTLAFLISMPFDRHRIVSNWLFMLAGRSFLWFNPFWKVEMTGIENYVPGKPMILIANHQSFLDMPLLATLPWRMKWVSKDGLFKVPILGWFMSMSGHVSVKRGTTAALKALDELKPFIKAGIPVMLFPEGTRSRSGELLKFKSGAFLLSKDMNVPVQPVLISGTRNVMKPDTWKTASTGKMTLTLMKQYNPYDFDDVNSMRDVIYNDMAQELNAMTNR